MRRRVILNIVAVAFAAMLAANPWFSTPSVEAHGERAHGWVWHHEGYGVHWACVELGWGGNPFGYYKIWRAYENPWWYVWDHWSRSWHWHTHETWWNSQGQVVGRLVGEYYVCGF